MGYNMKLLTTVLLLLALIISITEVYAEHRGLLIVVSFPSIADDVRKLVCRDDEVVSLAPPGVDPHEYQLTPQDVEMLKHANVIISTGHTPFEARIRQLVENREVEAKLIEIPRIPGMKILRNPVTGAPNYHMPIYDPHNYARFIEYLAQVLSSLRPECAAHYRNYAEAIVREIQQLIERAPKLNVTAVAANPMLQYAVNWLGIDVRYLIVREHGAQAIPSDVENAKKALGNIARIAIIMVPMDPASKLLENMAKERGVPLIRVEAPYTPGSVLSKILNIHNQVSNLSISMKVTTSKDMEGTEVEGGGFNPLFIAIVAILTLAGALILARARR